MPFQGCSLDDQLDALLDLIERERDEDNRNLLYLELSRKQDERTAQELEERARTAQQVTPRA